MTKNSRKLKEIVPRYAHFQIGDEIYCTAIDMRGIVNEITVSIDATSVFIEYGIINEDGNSLGTFSFTQLEKKHA